MYCNLCILMRILADLYTKLAFFFFFFSIILVIGYQVSFFIGHSHFPFFEPDNYEYYLFAKLAIQHNTFNVSNPYIIPFKQGFFEHSGLYELPVYLYRLVPNLIWDFRLLYLVPILVIYIIPLLIARRVFKRSIIAKGYRYIAYSMILLTF